MKNQPSDERRQNIASSCWLRVLLFLIASGLLIQLHVAWPGGHFDAEIKTPRPSIEQIPSGEFLPAPPAPPPRRISAPRHRTPG